jgi:hypothetical protein
MSVQNKEASVEPDVRVIVDEIIVNTVYDIFKEVMELNPVRDLFEDLADLLAKEMAAQSFMEFNLELKEDQRKALSRCVSAKGYATVQAYLGKVEKDKRTQKVYDIVKKKTKSIADEILSSIGKEINRGAIINATAVQASAKNDDYDEILLRKTKSSGDITIPTSCVLISTNCVSVIKSSCDEQITAEKRNENEADNSVTETTAAAPEYLDNKTDVKEEENIFDPESNKHGSDDISKNSNWEDVPF